MTEKQDDTLSNDDVAAAEERASGQAAQGHFDQITLDEPIQRGKSAVREITLRRPKAGELRGASLTDLIQMDVAALSRVLPRITQPVLSTDEINNMPPADLFQMGSAVAGFLLPKHMKQAPDATG